MNPKEVKGANSVAPFGTAIREEEEGSRYPLIPSLSSLPFPLLLSLAFHSLSSFLSFFFRSFFWFVVWFIASHQWTPWLLARSLEFCYWCLLRMILMKKMKKKRSWNGSGLLNLKQNKKIYLHHHLHIHLISFSALLIFQQS